MLYFLKLEPIVNRYNADWNVWFPEMFMKKGIEYCLVEGDNNIFKCDGRMYFDFKSVMSWKYEQLSDLMKVLGSSSCADDVVFIPDLYFPGIESLYFLKKLNNMNIKIVSVIHAGSYIPYDYTYLNGMERICKDLEEVWLNMCDLIFVATNYHKEKILECRNVDEDKIKVIGLPCDVEGLSRMYRVNEYDRVRDFVYAGRLGIDKGYDMIKFVESHCNIDIYKTFEHKLDKSDYYMELANSKSIIQPSRLETFSYAVVEAMSLDLIPIVPDGIAFDDYVPRKFRYDSYDIFDFIYKVEKVNDYKGEINMKKYVKKYQYQGIIGEMIKEIDKL